VRQANCWDELSSTNGWSRIRAKAMSSGASAARPGPQSAFVGEVKRQSLRCIANSMPITDHVGGGMSGKKKRREGLGDNAAGGCCRRLVGTPTKATTASSSSTRREHLGELVQMDARSTTGSRPTRLGDADVMIDDATAE